MEPTLEKQKKEKFKGGVNCMAHELYLKATEETF